MDVAVANQWRGKQEGWDFLPWTASVFPFPWVLNAELTGGWAGIGIVWETVPDLWMAVVFAFVWFSMRRLSKTVLFPRMARSWGIRKQARINKFCYNMWLLLFYSSSALFGYFYALPGEKYFAFPVDAVSGEAMFNYHPSKIDAKTQLYYMYQLGFYIAELYAIFVEAKRSDFIEYVIHHIVTIWLIGQSYVAAEHRVGANVIFIHDVPDIFLCVAKMFFYIKMENASSAAFAIFTVTFAYLRLYCLPLVSYVIFYHAPQYHPASAAFWVLGFLLSFVLQSLQIFWFIMIVKVIFKLVISGNDGDPRSDSDDDESRAAAKSKPSSKRASKKD